MRWSVGCQGLLDPENFLCDGHLKLVDLWQVREAAGLFAIENFLPIQVDFQAALTVGGQLQGDVAGRVGAPKLVRQPRGDREIPSRQAVKDLDFYFSELGA